MAAPTFNQNMPERTAALFILHNEHKENITVRPKWKINFLIQRRYAENGL